MDLLAVVGPDERFSQVNARWTEVLGWREDEIIGRHFSEFVHPDDIAGTEDTTDRAVVAGQSTTGFANRYRTKDGGFRWLLWETSALDGEGQWLCAGRDITRERETLEERDRLLAERESVLREHEALRRVATEVASAGRPAAVFQVVSQQAGELLGADAAAVVRLRGDAEVELVGLWGRVPPGVQKGMLVRVDDPGELASLLARGSAVRFDDRDKASLTGAFGYGSSVTAPVTIAGRQWGLLTALHRDPAGLQDADADRLQGFAELTAMAVANADARQELERRALTDSLTGLMNHRAFLDHLGAEVSRARRHGRRLAVAIVDLDHFKAVNDTHGHHVGDRALGDFARAIRKDHRLGDVIGRIGGDEIAMVLAESDAHGAYVALERLREEVAVLEHVSFSAGVAELDEDETAETVLRRADELLYKSKRDGRARTTIS
jgi:diguanylate cyclase (GGDEF)-like protein/PAS domain S-box-containing protein